jgi:hypothetical protein
VPLGVSEGALQQPKGCSLAAKAEVAQAELPLLNVAAAETLDGDVGDQAKPLARGRVALRGST